MKIDIHHIVSGESVELSHTYDADRYDLDYDDCHFANPIEFKATAHRESDVLQVNGVLSSLCTVTCSRCVEPFDIPLNEKVVLVFDIAGLEELDITDNIREILIFFHKQKYLCSQNCRGICSQCGKNLNAGSCSCKEDSENHPFEKLKELFNDRERK